ncbi:MAG: hypothetical protein ACYSTF_08040 [Planctomycetota bacterium]|jgi:hypothetical protein
MVQSADAGQLRQTIQLMSDVCEIADYYVGCGIRTEEGSPQIC